MKSFVQKSPARSSARGKTSPLLMNLEWTILLLLLLVVGYLFFSQNGFINAYGIKPYPY